MILKQIEGSPLTLYPLPQGEKDGVRGVIFAVSSRPGNMSLDYGDTADSLNNRREFLAKIGIDYRALVCARQVHGANVICITEKEKGRGALSSENAIPGTDALITNIRCLPLAVFTADCLPVFLYDLAAQCIGIVHAGWRSSKDSIVVKAIQLMRERFNIDSRNLCVFFGPAIRDCCYEVGEEFNPSQKSPVLKPGMNGICFSAQEEAPDFSPGNFTNYFADAVINKGGKYYLDLIAINKRQLVGSGVIESNISDSESCTCCCNEEYFSFRRERQACGRMMSVIMLR